MRSSFAILAMVFVSATTASIAAQTEGKAPSLDAFKACATIGDDGARLACFDKVASGFDFERAEAALEEASRLKAEAVQLRQEKQALAEQQAKREAEFEARKVTEFGKKDAEVRSVDQINTELRRVIEPRVGGKVLVLANGMVWQIQDGGRTGPLKPGMTLRVKKTGLGGYLMTFDLTKRTFRVKRVN